MGKYFGTDGIRGVANAPLSAILACRAGFAAAVAVADATGRRPVAVIGKDTRISGDMLESALSAGLCAGGADVIQVGVLPTPAVAYLTRYKQADLGFVISASHNAYEHNGIKIFNRNGFKLPDALETEIERLIDTPDELQKQAKTHDSVGRISREEHEGERDYIDYLLSLSEEIPFGVRIAVDCANGAASRTARVLFARLGVDATVLFDDPNGVNINAECGSTQLEPLRKTVRDGNYDIGFAFDGDADRMLIIDDNGDVIDGDVILAICARDFKERGDLDADTVVGTVMTNSGFREFAANYGITLLTADVGDRAVLEQMLKSGAIIGGETSGHTIFLRDATTGDGELTALKFLGVMARSGKRASELAVTFPRYPQIIVNVAVANDDKRRVMESDALRDAIAAAETTLGGAGRVFARPSGTEALVRVTVEAGTDALARDIAESVASAIKSIL
ncbi:MAG: phosphoglucosamine mutase [Oscillospiraceae bacterium]|jgi:phosphoglucosamine mutase|nr:phosphoglucosamine mutase [Oscillospiraceae bacterium]